MNTIQLSQRLASHLRVDDTTLLSSVVALDVLAAMNAGISAYYRELPPIYKRGRLSVTLKAPVTTSLTATAQYENTLSGTPFTLDQLGCTVAIDGIVPRNEVTGVNSLLDGWLIPTLTANATVYSDATTLPAIVERLVGDVQYFSQEHKTPVILTREDDLPTRRHHRGYAIESEPVLSLGRPRYYSIDVFTGDRGEFGTNAAFILRVWPLPAADCLIRTEADFAPRHLTMLDLSMPALIPVPPHRVEDILIPLCEAELVSSRWWRDASTKKGITDKAQEVLSRRVNQVAADLAAPRNRVGAPRGF